MTFKKQRRLNKSNHRITTRPRTKSSGFFIRGIFYFFGASRTSPPTKNVCLWLSIVLVLKIQKSSKSNTRENYFCRGRRPRRPASNEFKCNKPTVCVRDFCLLDFFPPFLSTPTKQSITFFQKMYVIGVFKGRFLWYNIYLVGFFKIFGRIWRI